MDEIATTPVVPNDADVESARADSARKANLAKGRAVLAEKRGPGRPAGSKTKTKDSQGSPSDAGGGRQSAEDDSGALLAGCRIFARAVWLLARFGAFIAGGTVAPLSDVELDEGAKEALPLVRRFGTLAVVLGFVGFPLWLARSVADKFTKDSRADKPADNAVTGSAAARDGAVSGATVHSIGAKS